MRESAGGDNKPAPQGGKQPQGGQAPKPAEAKAKEKTQGIKVNEYNQNEIRDILEKAERIDKGLKGDLYHRVSTFAVGSKEKFYHFKFKGKDGESYDLFQKIGVLNEEKGVFEFIRVPGRIVRKYTLRNFKFLV